MLAPPPVPQIVVCVPTYRRPEQLAALLRALDGQTIAEPFAVLIGNNDSASVGEIACPAAVEAREIFVAERGVTAVRNAMIANVLLRSPTPEWIACLDDDQVPAADWLAELVAAGRRHDAEIAGGPVFQEPAERTFWARGATSTDYLPTAEGPVDLLNEAGNLLLSTRFLRTLPRAAFSLDFGRTGGEDYEFFLYARTLGARIVWAPRAHVTEVIPRARLTLKGLVARAHSTAAYQTRADLRYRPAAKVRSAIVGRAARAPVAALRSLVRDRSPRLALSLFIRRAAGVTGALAGLRGRRVDRYGGEGG